MPGRRVVLLVSRVLGSLVVLSLLLAGCSSAPEGGPSSEDGDADPEDGGGVPSGPSEGRVEIRADLPDWEPGQGWRYVMDVPGHRTQSSTMVVAEERDDLWVVATDDHDQALHHVLFSLSPVLGRNGKQTLSPFQDGEPVEMYSFPLTDGKSWSAEFFGEPMEFTARYAGDISLQPELGLGEFAEGFQITASGPSGTRVTFEYVEAVEWFTTFEVVSPEGERLIRFDLLELISRKTGEYWFYRGEDLLIDRYASSVEDPRVERVEVPFPERHTDGLALAVTYQGVPASVPPVANVTLRGPPADSPLATVYFDREFSAPGHFSFLGEIDVERACLDAEDGSCEGPFRLDLRLAGEVEVEVRVVSYQVFAEGVL